MEVLIEEGLIDSEKDTETFDEFTLVSLYASAKKVGVEFKFFE